MANISTFGMTVVGPLEQLNRLTQMILRDTEPMPEGPYSGEFVFTLKTETWGNREGSQDFLWLREIGQYIGQAVLGEHACHGELRIFGESKWFPPLVFGECILERFPSLDVDIKSETEHELYEHWRSGYGQRHLVCRHEQLTNPKDGTILRLVIDGHQILPYGEEQQTASSEGSASQVIDDEDLLAELTRLDTQESNFKAPVPPETPTPASNGEVVPTTVRDELVTK